MIFLTSFSTRLIIFLCAILVGISGCAVKSEPAGPVSADAPGGGSELKIAVLPVVNMSGTPAPMSTINQALINSLNRKALNILVPDVVEGVITKHRIRYLGGINYTTSRVFREEAGVEAVLISSLELYSEIAPPKIALTSRLVSTTKHMPVLWMRGIGLAGNESPGLLDLRLVEDPQVLLKSAVQNLSSRLARFLSGQADGAESQRIRNIFQPRASFRAPILDSDMQYRVAVIPFFNVSERKHAGEMIALQFVKTLNAYHNFFVIEPGVVRQTLLDMRIIMQDGLSLADADLIFSRLKADLVLSGDIMDFQDYKGFDGRPRVDFSAQIIAKKNREIVWVVKSYNQGDDRVFFFDWGKVHTAYAMTTKMVQLAVEDLVQ
jgi:TolB-like protein